MTWKPIDTAPADGKPIVLFLDPPVNTNDIVGYATVDSLSVVVGWNTGTQYRDGSIEWVCGLCDEGSADTEGYSTPYMIRVQPTHWMPLPAAPK
jgi:hypothetical protein